MKTIQKNITVWNNYKILFLYPNEYKIIDIIIDIPMSNQELNTYLSYKVNEVISEKTLFFYIKQQDSYLVFITKKSYIENLTNNYPKSIIAPLPIIYKSLLNNDNWIVFNINKKSAFVVSSINGMLKTNSLPISFEYISLDERGIIITIVSFINNIMPHIDKEGIVDSIYFNSCIDDIQDIEGKNVYKNINIKKLAVENFNPKKLCFNFANIKSFRFYFLIGLLAFIVAVLLSTRIYLQMENNQLSHNMKLHNKQYKTINHKIQTIKDIKSQIINIQQNNDKKIVPSSNFAHRLSKVLSSQTTIIKTISIDINSSYVE